MGLMNLLQRGVNDVIHPFGIGAPHPAAPQPQPQQQQFHAPMAMPQQRVATPAPMNMPKPIATTPAPGQNMAKFNFSVGQAPKIQQQPQQPKQSLASRAMGDINHLANSNWNPTHLVENYAVKPAVELGTGIGHQIYNRGIAPVAGLPHETLGTAFKNSKVGNLAANANAISHLSAGHQVANAISVASNAIPGAGGLVDNFAEKVGGNVAGKVGSQLAGKVIQKGVQYAGHGLVGAATGAGINGASTAAQGGNLKQILQSAKTGAEFGGVMGSGVPVLADTAPHVVNGVRVAAPVVKQGVQAASSAIKDTAQHPMSTPQIRANLHDQQVLHDYTDYLTGAYKPTNSELNTLISQARQVGAKHGIDLTNGTVKSHVDGANSILDTLGQQRQAVVQGGYIGPGGKNIPSLPKELSGAKPSYGSNQLKFPDDVTKSLYIVGGKGQSASHSGYMDFLHQALPGKSDAQLQTMGNQVRDSIKTAYKGNGSIDVPQHPAVAQLQHNPQTGQIAKPSAQLPQNALKTRNTPDSPVTTLKDALTAKQAKLQAQKAGEAPTEQTVAPTAAPGKKLSRFSNVTVPNSDLVPDNVRKLTQEQGVQYTPQATKAGQDAAQAFVKQSGNLDKATNKVLSNLHNTDPGQITRQDVFNAQAVADKLAKTGKTDDAMTSAEIYGALSGHHTAAGQQIQAAAALAKQSPQGLHQMAIKAITNGGKNGATQKISEDVAKQVSDKVAEIDKADKTASAAKAKLDKNTDPTARNALNDEVTKTGQARDDRVQELQKIVNQNVHHSTGSKLFTLWRTGLLTGPQTMTKVALSHAIMAGAEKVKDIPAVAIDKTISGASRLVGKGPMRSTALTLRGEGTGFAKGTAAGVKLLKTGLDTKGTGGQGDSLVGKLAKPEVDFGNSKLGKAANFYVQKTGGIHASIPKGFFTAAQANDLFKQAIAEGINKGLKGSDLQTHVDNYVAGATDFAKQEAQLSAQRASFQQDTALGKIGRAAQQVPGGKWVMPFAKIASTILNDAVDYSPGGALKAGWQAFKDTKGAGGWTPTVQKHFVEELGRSITGTAAIAAGVELYKHGVMTLGYPTSKPEQAIWKAQGKTPNSILIGGKWHDTSALGPFGTLLFMGGSVAQSGQHDAKGRSQVGAAATGALQNITSQSYLSGLTSAANALSDPTQFAGSEEKQLAGSVVPIAVATAARATDPLQRNTPGVAQSVESKIPGLRESLTPQQDMFGRQLPRQGGVVANLVDPSRPSGMNAGPQVNELQRLENTTATSAVPAQIKSINGTNANGKKTATALNQQQQNAITSAVGPKIQAAYQQMMNDPRYQQLSDANKVSALNSAKDNIETVQKAQTLKSINGGTVKLTAAQQTGQTPDYIQNKLNEQSGGTAGTPLNAKLDPTSRATLNAYNGMSATARNKAAYLQNNFDYNYTLAKYNNDLLNGSLSEAGQVTAKEALAKAAVGANYSKNVRDLYGLSKAELSSFLASDPNGNSDASQLQSYDQALYNAGLISSRKFKNGFGSGSSSGSSSKSTSLPTAISYKNTAPKTNLGKFKVSATKGIGSSKAKLVGYSHSNPTKAGSKSTTKVGKLPNRAALKMPKKVALSKPAAVFKPKETKLKKFKGQIV